MKICEKCGKKYDNTWKACLYCRNSLSDYTIIDNASNQKTTLNLNKKKQFITIVCVFFLIIFIFSFIIAYSGVGPFIRSENVVFKNPYQAVIDARNLMEEKKSVPDKYRNWIFPKDEKLPQSLNISRLNYVEVYEDHINLVLSRNPDWTIGARIWSADSNRKHNDKHTQYKNIYFFKYTNDSKESPDNIL